MTTPETAKKMSIVNMQVEKKAMVKQLLLTFSAQGLDSDEHQLTQLSGQTNYNDNKAKIL